MEASEEARAEVRVQGQGATQAGQRDHNERLILSTVQRHGSLSGGEVARLARLSPQTVSVILRGLEAEGLVERGDPQRGRVGAPRLPVRLRPDGAFALGLKLGRRSADLVLTDLGGAVRGALRTAYRWPEPGGVLAFLREGLAALTAGLPPGRVAGVGIAKPFEIWDWHESLGAPPGALDAWRGVDLAKEARAFTDLPVFTENDATAAARAEHLLGRGRAFRDYAYVFVGSFVGGGLVLGHAVFDGPSGNAAAFGSLPARLPGGGEGQLIDAASLFLLEDALARRGVPPDALQVSADWDAFEPELTAWVEGAGPQLARAALTVAAVVDVEAVLIDGAFPPDVRRRLVAAVRAALPGLDRRGLVVPRIEEGSVGADARALGAAAAPILSRFLLNAPV